MAYCSVEDNMAESLLSEATQILPYMGTKTKKAPCGKGEGKPQGD
jgi:hypothetical protein